MCSLRNFNSFGWIIPNLQSCSLGESREPSLRAGKINTHRTEDDTPEYCRRQYGVPLEDRGRGHFAIVERGEECSQYNAGNGRPLIEP